MSALKIMKTLKRYKPEEPDIPLAEAMLCWTENRQNLPESYRPGAVKVIRHPLPDFDVMRLHGLYNDVGASSTDWKGMSQEEQLHVLLREAWWMIGIDGIDPKAIHYALMVIPEYREGNVGIAFSHGLWHDDQ